LDNKAKAKGTSMAEQTAKTAEKKVGKK